jgi:hypothetical protein
MDVSTLTLMSVTGNRETVLGIVRAHVHLPTSALVTSARAGEVMPATGK